MYFSHICTLKILYAVNKLTRPGPIVLLKLSIILLSNAPKLSLLSPNYAPLCHVMLHMFIKFLLTESKNKPIILNFKLPNSLNNYLTVLLEYIDLFHGLLKTFSCWFCAHKMLCIVLTIIPTYYHNPSK